MATATVEHYHDWSAERILRVRPGAISVDAGVFSGGVKLKVGGASQTPSAYANANPNDAEIFWQLVRGEHDCTLVDGQNGEVTARAVPIDPNSPPVCSLQLVAQKSGYDTFVSAPVEVPLQLGDLGAVTAPVFGYGTGNILPKEGHLDISSMPAEQNGLPIVISAIEAEGYQSNGTTAKSGVCSIEEESGRVMAGDAAADGDKCKINTTVEAIGYASKAALEVVLTVASTSVEFDAGVTMEFVGDLKVGALTDPSVAPGATDDNSGTHYLNLSALPTTYNSQSITWHYRGQGCQVVVNQQDNARIHLAVPIAAEVGASCRIVAIAQVAEHIDGEISLSIPLVAGDLVFGSSSLYSGSLRMGAMVDPVGHDNDDNSVPVAWGSWRAEGVDSGDNSKADVCTVDSEGVVTTSSAAVAGDVCKLYAVASSDNFNDTGELAVGTLTVAAQAVFGAITPPVYDGHLAIRGKTLSIRTAPIISGVSETITWTYSTAAAATICTVDESSGAVTPGGNAQIGDTCPVVATANAPGYSEKSATGTEILSLTVRDTFTSMAWAGFTGGSFEVGRAYNSVAAPVTVPAVSSNDFSYSVVSGDCTVTAGQVQFNDVAECAVRVTASKNNFISYSRVFRKSPLPGTIVVAAWGTYSGIKVGAAAVSPSGLSITTAGTEKSYDVAEDSVGCAVSSAGAVTATASGSGTCKVVLTLSKQGYNDKANTYTMSVAKGTWTSVAWDGYANNAPVFGNANPVLVAPVSSPIADSWAYSVTSGNTICSVGATSGALTISGVGSCTIKAVPGKLHYVTHTGTSQTVTISKGSQTLTWSNAYGSSPSLTVASGANLNPSGSTPVGQGAVRFRVKTSDNAKCRINSNNGRVWPLAAGGGSSCVIQARFAGNANYHASSWTDIATITINKATISVAGMNAAEKWGGDYGSVAVGADTAAPTVGAITPGSVTKTYSSNDATKCTVVASTGAVTGVRNGNNNCVITLTLTKLGYTTVTHTYATISVAKGTITAVSWSPPSTGTVGTNLTLPDPTGTDVAGTITFHKVSGSNCSLSGNTLSFSNTGACVVKARIVRDHYNRWESANTTITAVAGTITGVSWSPTQSTGTVDTSLTLDAVTTGIVNGDTIAYNYVSGDCSFGSGSEQNERTLSFTDTSDCVVTASVDRSGYGTWTSGQHTITVSAASWGAESWGGYNRGHNRASYGDRTGAPASPNITPTPDGWTYTTTSAATVCTVEANTGVVSYAGSGDCVVTVVPHKTGYATHPGMTVTISILEGLQIQPGAWGTSPPPYDSNSPTVAVGETLALGAVTEPVNSAFDGGALYYWQNGGTGSCNVDPDNGNVQGVTVGTCRIEAFFRSVHNKWIPGPAREVAIVTVYQREITGITWTPQTSGTVGTDLTLTGVSGHQGTDTVTYIAIGSGCSINGTTLSFTHSNHCVVKARVERSSHVTWHSELKLITAAASSNSMTFNSSIASYDMTLTDRNGTLGFGNNSVATPTPTLASTDAGSVGVAVTVEVVGFDSDGFSKDNVCTVDTNGAVSAGSAAALDDQCIVLANAVDNDGVSPLHTPYSEWVATLTLKRAQRAPNSRTGPYSTALSNGTSRGRGAPTGGDNNGGGYGSAEYRVQTGYSDYCSVDSNTGVITLLQAGNCIIEARWSGNSEYNPSGWSVSTNLVIGGF